MCWSISPRGNYSMPMRAILTRSTSRGSMAPPPAPLRWRGGRVRRSACSTERSTETLSCKLSQRDVVLLFTDGLFEVEGSEGELYDYEKLSKAVGCRTELPAAELCRSLIDEVQHFSATQQFNDDVCFVAMDIDRLKPL